MTDENQRIITLTLTQACNLSCVYCYEANKSSKRMTFEQAKEILDSEFANLPKDTCLEIDFFGGEPLLEFQLLTQIVDYVETSYADRDHLYFIITNGTLLNSEIKAWLVQHLGSVVCGLSFDGNKEMQDVNRSNSFDLVDLDFFAKYYPAQQIKMTVSPYSLSSLAEGVIFLQNKGFEVACNLAYGIEWTNPDLVAVLERELGKLIEYYLAYPEMPICSMLDMGIEKIAMKPEKMTRFCGSGIDMAAYDVDGGKYPCQLFMPLSAGEEKAKKANTIHFYEDEIPEELLDENCVTCPIKAVCPTCYGANYISTGNIYRHDSSQCHLTKIIMKARSYLKGELWCRNRLQLSEAEEALLLKSISILQESL